MFTSAFLSAGVACSSWVRTEFTAAPGCKGGREVTYLTNCEARQQRKGRDKRQERGRPASSTTLAILRMSSEGRRKTGNSSRLRKGRRMSGGCACGARGFILFCEFNALCICYLQNKEMKYNFQKSPITKVQL